MVIYGDILIVENFLTGLVLLTMTDIVCRSMGDGAKSMGMIFCKGSGMPGIVARLRLAGGGIMCGFFSLTIFVPAGHIMNILMQMAFAPAVCLVTFGKKLIFQRALTFILVTYFTGGMVMGLLLVTGNTGYFCGTGIYSGDMKAAVLAVFMAVTAVTVRQTSRVVMGKKLYREHAFDVKIVIGEFSHKARGFLDTGNSLREAVKGKPVAVAERGLWERLEKGGAITPRRLCIIPFNAVKGGGIMEGVRTDYVQVGRRKIGGCVIARGEEELFCGREEFQLLLSNNMNEGGL